MKNPFSKKKGGDQNTGNTQNTVPTFRVGGGFVSTRPTADSEEIRKKIGELEARTNNAKFDRTKHKDTKRSHIALVFVYGYMSIVTILIIGAPLYNALVLENPEAIDIERLLSQVGSLIGAPLGFVIGYYFKEDK